MSDIPGSATWQATVANAVASMEQRTGLTLAGLSATEITRQVKEWVKAKQNGALMGQLHDSRQEYLMAVDEEANVN